jgi:hypothetical protein
MERLKPLFPLDPRFNQGRNQYPWEPRGKVTGYASLHTPRPPPPPNPLKKPRRRVEIVGERRRRWRGGPSDVLEMEGYPSLPLRVALGRYSTKISCTHLSLHRNTFSFISPLVFLLRSYGIQFFFLLSPFFDSPVALFSATST